MNRGALLKAYNDLLAKVSVPGIKASVVQEILGSPTAIYRPGTHPTPSDVFSDLGFTFHLPAEPLDEIWAFSDPYRPRVTHFIGLQHGRVSTFWRETSSLLRGAD